MKERKPRDLLIGLAKRLGRPTDEILQYYAMERLLYRLSRSRYADRFVLKGGLLIHAWDLGPFRTTRDIDLLGSTSNAPGEMVKIFREVCDLDLEFEDGVEYSTDTIAARVTQTNNIYSGLEVKLRGSIGRSLVHLRVDVGFSDRSYPAPVAFEFPVLLPQFSSPYVMAYTVESVVAEKVDAMVQLGTLNTRMKDFHDVRHLSCHLPFELGRLRETIFDTMKRRGTVVPDTLVILDRAFSEDPARVQEWENFCARSKLPVTPFHEIMNDLKSFLQPVFQRSQQQLEWHPTQKRWYQSSSGV